MKIWWACRDHNNHRPPWQSAGMVTSGSVAWELTCKTFSINPLTLISNCFHRKIFMKQQRVWVTFWLRVAISQAEEPVKRCVWKGPWVTEHQGDCKWGNETKFNEGKTSYSPASGGMRRRCKSAPPAGYIHYRDNRLSLNKHRHMQKTQQDRRQ